MTIDDARSLDDLGLTAALKNLAATEREATVALIVHLAEFDARQLYREAGFPSLMQYCLEVLRLSEDAAWNRVAAARVARRFPEVVDRLVAGSLSPTTVRLIARHIKDESGRALIDAATGKTKRQVEDLLARLYPEADVPASIRPLGPRPAVPLESPSAVSAPPPPSLFTQEPSADPAVTGSAPAWAAASVVPDAQREGAVVAATETARELAPPDRFAVRFTARADTIEKLKMVQDLLSHAVPDGDIGEVVDRALSALAEELLKKKFAVTVSPRNRSSASSLTAGTASASSSASPDPPAAVKRAVWFQDRGRCAWVSKDGRRCGSRKFLQIDHVDGRFVGSAPTPDKFRLLCGAHNRLSAERLYGTPVGARDGGGSRVSLERFPEFIRPGTEGRQEVTAKRDQVDARAG
jgi:hypothetical protein